MIRKSVTMGDVARELGVSTVSVSKALTGKEGVSEAVREMIIKKAEEMGYRYTGSKKDNSVVSIAEGRGLRLDPICAAIAHLKTSKYLGLDGKEGR